MFRITGNSNTRLFTPGPTEVPIPILEEIFKFRIHHRSSEFKNLYISLTAKLKEIFRTNHYLTVLTSSGTGAMEAVVVNFCSYKDKIIYLDQGKFGQRWGLICKANGIKSEAVKVKPGCVLDSFHDTNLDLSSAKVFLLTHVETSTGALTNIKKLIYEIRNETDALIAVDGIASIGSVEFNMDNWGVDIAITASQKGFMNPPGISVIAYNERAKAKMEQNKSNRFYFDLKKELDAFLSNGYTSWTPALGLFHGMDKASSIILEEGLENHWNKIKRLAKYFREAALKLGFKLFSDSLSDSVTALLLPDKLDSTVLISRLKDNHNVIIANGQGELKGKIIRVSHMGNYTLEDFKFLIDVMDKELSEMIT